MTPASDEPDTIPSLWERLGGTEGADALIEAFYDRIHRQANDVPGRSGHHHGMIGRDPLP